MKKLSACALLLLLALGLCSCARVEVVPAEPEETPPPEFLWRHSLAPFDEAETARMLRAMGGGRGLVLDGALYCLDYDQAYRPLLARYLLTEEGPAERQVLAEDCLPESLLEAGGWLYYCNGGALERIAPDGSGREVLRQGESRSLQSRDGLLYFCDGQGRFLELDPETGRERTVLEGPCCYPWLREDALLYQSDGDSSLHVRWLSDGTEDSFPLSPGYAPLGAGNLLYYSTDRSLVCLGLDGLGTRERELPGLRGTVELVPGDGGWVLRWIAEENGLEQFTLIPGGEKPQPAAWQGYRLCDYAGDGWRLDSWYGSDGRLRCFFLTDPQGTETAFLAGRIGLDALLPPFPGEGGD